MHSSSDAGSVRHGVDPTNISKLLACLVLAGLGALFNDPLLIGLGVSIYIGWFAASWFRVSVSRRLTIRLFLTWVCVLLTSAINAEGSVVSFPIDPLSVLRLCVGSWIVCLVALAVVETGELFLVMAYCLIRNWFRLAPTPLQNKQKVSD